MIWLVYDLDLLILPSTVSTGQMSIIDALTSYYIGQPMKCEVGVAQSCFSDVPPVELARTRLTKSVPDIKLDYTF